MKTMNERFFKKKFCGKYLIVGQKIYLEQIYERQLNLVVNHCWQYYNGIILLQ